MTEDDADIRLASDIVWGALFLTASTVVATFGEPRALSLIVAGAGIITGAVIIARALDRR